VKGNDFSCLDCIKVNDYYNTKVWKIERRVNPLFHGFMSTYWYGEDETIVLYCLKIEANDLNIALKPKNTYLCNPY
jgi:hypothetical protein